MCKFAYMFVQARSYRIMILRGTSIIIYYIIQSFSNAIQCLKSANLYIVNVLKKFALFMCDVCGIFMMRIYKWHLKLDNILKSVIVL